MIEYIIAIALTASTLVLGTAAYEEHQEAKRYFKAKPVFRRGGYDYPPIPDDSWKFALMSLLFGIASGFMWWGLV